MSAGRTILSKEQLIALFLLAEGLSVAGANLASVEVEVSVTVLVTVSISVE